MVIIGATNYTATAQYKHKKAHAKKVHLVQVVKEEDPDSNTSTTNVVFPKILCGNEEQSMAYIEKFSTNRRAYLIRTYNRSKYFFPKAISILTKHHLPEEFTILLALESAFNANAISKAGAVGYWQIMDEVAKEYGLKYTPQIPLVEKKKQKIKKIKKQIFKDDRKDFIKSTYAAARYLKDRSRNLNNDPLLVVASYNCGVGNVWNAMEKTGKNNPTFWDVKNYLPAETRSYVMNFITLNVIFKNYKRFTNNTLTFNSLKVEADVDEASLSEVTTLLHKN